MKKLINCCFSQNIRKHKLTAYYSLMSHFQAENLKKNGSLNVNLEWKKSSTAASPKI